MNRVPTAILLLPERSGLCAWHDRLARDSRHALDAHRHEPAHVGQLVGTFRLARVPWVKPLVAHHTVHKRTRADARASAPRQ